MSEGHAYKCDYCGNVSFYNNELFQQDRRIAPPGWFTIYENGTAQWELHHYCDHKCAIAGIKP